MFKRQVLGEKKRENSSFIFINGKNQAGANHKPQVKVSIMLKASAKKP